MSEFWVESRGLFRHSEISADAIVVTDITRIDGRLDDFNKRLRRIERGCGLRHHAHTPPENPLPKAPLKEENKFPCGPVRGLDSAPPSDMLRPRLRSNWATRIASGSTLRGLGAR